MWLGRRLPRDSRQRLRRDELRTDVPAPGGERGQALRGVRAARDGCVRPADFTKALLRVGRLQHREELPRYGALCFQQVRRAAGYR